MAPSKPDTLNPKAYLLAVVYERELDAIAERGLGPEDEVMMYPPGDRPFWLLPGERAFATDERGLCFLFAEHIAYAYDISTNPSTDRLAVFVLRIKKPRRLDVEEDDELTAEAHARCVRTSTTIPPDAIEVWDGERWIALPDADALDPSLGFVPTFGLDEDDLDDDEEEEGEQDEGDEPEDESDEEEGDAEDPDREPTLEDGALYACDHPLKPGRGQVWMP